MICGGRVKSIFQIDNWPMEGFDQTTAEKAKRKAMLIGDREEYCFLLELTM